MPIQSSRPVGATSHFSVLAWIQYSRTVPPGCGAGVAERELVDGVRPGRRRALHGARSRVGGVHVGTRPETLRARTTHP